MDRITKKRESIGGCTVSFLEVGNAGKRDLILLHGMKFNAETWHKLGTIDKLAEAGHKVFAMDLPGFGESPSCDTAPPDVIRSFILQHNLEKPVIVGPSMSGRISLELSLDQPDLLGGVVLLGAVGVKENRDRLHLVTAPTLILWGDNDKISHIDNGRLLHEKIKRSIFIKIKGAGHPCYLDEPGIWHRELISFLKGLA